MGANRNALSTCNRSRCWLHHIPLVSLTPGAYPPMKRRILLVDDELAILLTLKAILEINGFEVETATSAKEGISKVKAGTFDMVITDMKMESERSGYEVVRAAKKAEYRPATAILTAYPML